MKNKQDEQVGFQQVEQWLEGVCGFCRMWVHAVRMRALMAAVAALIRCGSLSCAALGRALPGEPKHGIKRIDRLLGNPKLWSEAPLFYSAIARTLLGSVQQPIILLDWTKAADEFNALVASLAMDGRSIPLYVEVHREEKCDSKRLHARYLKGLRSILPDGCRPVLILDAGFGSDFVREIVQTMGWNFVVRLRGTRLLQKEGSDSWLSCSEVYTTAKVKPQEIGRWFIAKTDTKHSYRLILKRQPKRRSRRKKGSKKSSSELTDRTYRKRAQDPWLLATSLDEPDAQHIVNLYSKRMQIEETFRDLKNHRFGWSLRHVRCASAERIAVLLLIASLAMVATLIVGRIAERTGRYRNYQSNTVTSRRVLSFFVLGALILQRGDTSWLTLEEFHHELCALQLLFFESHEQCFAYHSI